VTDHQHTWGKQRDVGGPATCWCGAIQCGWWEFDAGLIHENIHPLQECFLPAIDGKRFCEVHKRLEHTSEYRLGIYALGGRL
jgi:hypothetical protein